MLRRVALKNISLITGGVFFLPYSCDLNPDFYYSNFPKLKRKEKRLINSICEVILPSDKINFPTSENRGHFVLTIVNDCLDKDQRDKFSSGFEAFQLALSSEEKKEFEDILPNEQEIFILKNFKEKKDNILTFLEYLKEFSLLHFETSENYMKKYLKFEFMPGRYIGKVPL